MSDCVLRAADLHGSNELPLTQEFLVEMLELSRVSVNVIAHTLQHAGMLKYARGHIKLLDITALRETACECYQAVKLNYEALIQAELRLCLVPQHKKIAGQTASRVAGSQVNAAGDWKFITVEPPSWTLNHRYRFNSDVRNDPNGRGLPCSGGEGRGLRGFDVENSNSVRVALEAKRGDCVVNVGDVGVEAAEIAFAFCTAFAQCSHRARLYHFEKIEPRR